MLIAHKFLTCLVACASKNTNGPESQIQNLGIYNTHQQMDIHFVLVWESLYVFVCMQQVEN